MRVEGGGGGVVVLFSVVLPSPSTTARRIITGQLQNTDGKIFRPKHTVCKLGRERDTLRMFCTNKFFGLLCDLKNRREKKSLLFLLSNCKRSYTYVSFVNRKETRYFL